MSEESKIADTEASKDIVKSASVDNEDDDIGADAAGTSTSQDAGDEAVEKKKKSKKAKLKKALGRGESSDAGEGSTSGAMTEGMVQQILQLNPSLKAEIAGMNQEQIAEKLKTLDLSSLLTGMVRQKPLSHNVLCL